MISVSTAVPSEKLAQSVVLNWARRTLGSKLNQFERMAKAFENAGIASRYSIADISWFETPKSWPERNEVYLQGATQLFVEAGARALREANWAADEIDAVVTVSSTGIATPTLEARAFVEMGFRDDIMRIPVFGLGCAGGVTGLAIARDIAAATPNTRVLLVAVEACSVSFCAGTPNKSDIIGSALFGDGAAAACVTSEHISPGSSDIIIGKGAQKIWPDTLSIMGWDVEEDSLGVVFDKSIPAFTQQYFFSAVTDALAKMGKQVGEIDRFVCHPGGAKVLQAIEQCMQLQPGILEEERNVLSDYGNMSAPTVLFVLKQVLENNNSGEMLMCSLGPGFTASFLPLGSA